MPTVIKKITLLINDLSSNIKPQYYLDYESREIQAMIRVIVEEVRFFK